MTAPTDFADEVVTQALVRYLDVPGVAGEFALITLDNGHDHTRPSTFGPAGLASLDAALDDIEAHPPKVAAVAVTGKPFIFAVGADISGVPTDHRSRTGRADRPARAIGCSAGSRTVDVPTFAFVNGAVMGGGLELALHCDYRTLASSAAAIAFPEVFLGLVPGWGGTQLLPNLIGPGRRGHGDHRERAEPEQDADAEAGGRARRRRRAAGSRRLPRRVVAVGGEGARRFRHGRPARSRSDDWDGALARGRAFARGQEQRCRARRRSGRST